MKIKITTHIAAAFPTPYGEVITVDDKVGEAWIEAGIAEEVKDKPVKETAVSHKAVETADNHRNK